MSGGGYIGRRGWVCSGVPPATDTYWCTVSNRAVRILLKCTLVLCVNRPLLSRMRRNPNWSGTSGLMMQQECIPVGCVPSATVAVSRGGVCLGRGVSAQEERCLPGECTPPPGQNDRRLWKQYLSATTVADGRYWHWRSNRIAGAQCGRA